VSQDTLTHLGQMCFCSRYSWNFGNRLNSFYGGGGLSRPPSPRSDHNSAAIWDALLQLHFWDLKADASACRHIHEQLTHAVQQAVDQYQGSECLLLILDALQAEATKVVDEAQQHAVERSRGSQEKLEAKVRSSQIGRRSIW